MSEQVDYVRGRARVAGSFQNSLFSLSLELEVVDPETVAELKQFSDDAERERFALNALRIGVLALRQARGQVDGEQIRRESERLLLTLEKNLAAHSAAVHDRLAGSLKEYFDPESGRFQERVQRLICKDGELEEVLRRQIGGNGSELSKTLAGFVGHDSPLLKILSPNESAGLLTALRETVGEQLQQQRERILDQFSLNNKESALSRLIVELSTGQEKLTGDIQQRIDEVVREFSLDEENSALSRLVRNVEGAQRTITNEFSLDNDASALSRLKRMLESTQEAIDSNLTLDSDDSALSRLRKEVLEILNRNSQSSLEFQNEVKLTLERMVVQRAEAARSTRHGLIFEDVVCDFLTQEARKLGDIATRTGETTGLIRNCKVGDCVLELGPESAAPGAKIVVEAKEKEQFQVSKAREEIEKARNNRGAQVGIFIFSSKSAPQEMASGPLVRYGDDVLVTWDPEDAQTDLYLRTALTLARALCIRASKQSEAQSADFEEIDRAILEIEKKTESLGEIEIWAKTIQSNADNIIKRVDVSRRALARQSEALREKISDLKQLVGDPPTS